MHAIGSDSPPSPYLHAREIPRDAEIVLLLSGTEERSGQAIQARWAYRPADIYCDARFVDIIGLLPKGTRTIDYRHSHEVES